jgi:hypothetical protein
MERRVCSGGGWRRRRRRRRRRSVHGVLRIYRFRMKFSSCFFSLDKPGNYTEFLLKVSTRLFKYLGQADKSAAHLGAELQRVAASAECANNEI